MARACGRETRRAGVAPEPRGDAPVPLGGWAPAARLAGGPPARRGRRGCHVRSGRWRRRRRQQAAELDPWRAARVQSRLAPWSGGVKRRRFEVKRRRFAAAEHTQETLAAAATGAPRSCRSQCGTESDLPQPAELHFAAEHTQQTAGVLTSLNSRLSALRRASGAYFRLVSRRCSSSLLLCFSGCDSIRRVRP